MGRGRPVACAVLTAHVAGGARDLRVVEQTIQECGADGGIAEQFAQSSTGRCKVIGVVPPSKRRMMISRRSSVNVALPGSAVTMNLGDSRGRRGRWRRTRTATKRD
jgi:hypothetical protein